MMPAFNYLYSLLRRTLKKLEVSNTFFKHGEVIRVAIKNIVYIWHIFAYTAA